MEPPCANMAYACQKHLTELCMMRHGQCFRSGLPIPRQQKHSPACKRRPHCMVMYLFFHSLFSFLCFTSLKITLEDFHTEKWWLFQSIWSWKPNTTNQLYFSVLSFFSNFSCPSPNFFLWSLLKITACLHFCTYPLPLIMGTWFGFFLISFEYCSFFASVFVEWDTAISDTYHWTWCS